jgi:cohesin complex subunit SCC1
MMMETPQTPLMPPVLPPDMSNLSNLLPPEHPMPTPDHLGASLLGHQMHSTPAQMMHLEQELPDPSLMMSGATHPMVDQSHLGHSMQQEQMPPMENLGYDQSAGPLMANMGYDEQLPPAVTPGGHGPTTPWHDLDNEEFPHSVGPPEEQQTDETYEQYEERVLNKRAVHMYHILKGKIDLNPQRPMFFSEMTHRNSRKQVNF